MWLVTHNFCLLAALIKVSVTVKYKKMRLLELKRRHDSVLFYTLLWIDSLENDRAASKDALNKCGERISLSLPYFIVNKVT
jgi:hypothetical protein